jgi:hypothetical protein
MISIGGRIQDNPNVETEEVNMTSVDTILRNWNLEDKLDILKIDTEGNDNKVNSSELISSVSISSICEPLGHCGCDESDEIVD